MSVQAPAAGGQIQEKGLGGALTGGALGLATGNPLAAVAGGGIGSMAEDKLKPKALDGAHAPAGSPALTKEQDSMTDAQLAKSVSDLADIVKAIVPALNKLDSKVSALGTDVANIRKEIPIKDGAKYAKDEAHNATEASQETQVHEATSEAAVKTFTPENKTEGSFAPKLKAQPAPTRKVNLEDLVAKAVEARLAKSMPTVSATPAPTTQAPPAAPTDAPWKAVMKSVVDHDRKIHGVFSKNPEGVDTGFRPGDESIKLESARFVAKMRKTLGA